MIPTLCGFVGFTTGRFMLRFAVLFALVFSILFRMVITPLGEERAGL